MVREVELVEGVETGVEVVAEVRLGAIFAWR